MASDATAPTTTETDKTTEELQRKARAAITKEALQVQQSDPNSPLYSVKTFEELELPQALLDGVYKLGYQKPSKIQEVAIPNIVKKPDHHFVGQAQAGTGKTAAFALSALARVDQNATTPQVLVLCPTRELTNQVAESFQELAQLIPSIKVVALVKDAVLPDVLDAQILVGPPGSVQDAVKKRRFDPKKLIMVVIDEADQMIQPSSNPRDSMWPQTQILLRSAPNAQICLFSATFPPDVLQAVDKLLSSPAPGSKEPRQFTKITLRPEEQSLDQIHEFYLVCLPEQKDKALERLFKAATLGSTVIFVNTKSGADRMLAWLKKEGHEVSLLHSGLSSAERDATMRNFRESVIRVLIVTNIFARGINIPEITTVINYDMPIVHGKTPVVGDAATYLHRIGRSGRFGADGTAISLITTEEDMSALKQINAELCAVNPETNKAKRKREIKKLSIEDITPFTQVLESIQESSV